MAGSIEYLNVDPNVAASHFQQNFDLNRPDQAMSSYQKQMHQHTQKQFDPGFGHDFHEPAFLCMTIFTLATSFPPRLLLSTISGASLDSPCIKRTMGLGKALPQLWVLGLGWFTTNRAV